MKNALIADTYFLLASLNKLKKSPQAKTPHAKKMLQHTIAQTKQMLTALIKTQQQQQPEAFKNYEQWSEYTGNNKQPANPKSKILSCKKQFTKLLKQHKKK